jgi:hypothetical protein
MANIRKCELGMLTVLVALLALAGQSAQADDTDTLQLFRQGLQLLDDFQKRSGGANNTAQRQSQYRSNPLARGAAGARYHWCGQLTRHGMATALAAAPLGDAARGLVFRNSGNGYLLEQCASQLHYHLCTTEIINLTGSFLTGGPGANAFVDALPEVTDAVATRRANPMGLLGATAAAVGTTAWTGSVTKGAVGGVVGYGAGTTLGKGVDVLSCDQRRAMVVAMSDRFRRQAFGETARHVDQLFARNNRYVPTDERSVYNYALALSREMRQKAHLLQRALP